MGDAVSPDLCRNSLKCFKLSLGERNDSKRKSCTLWLGKIGFHMNLLSATGEGLAAEGEQELLVEGASVRGCGTEGGGEVEPKKSFGFLSPRGCRRAGLAAHLAAGPREYGAVPLRSHRTLLRIHRLGGSVLSSETLHHLQISSKLRVFDLAVLFRACKRSVPLLCYKISPSVSDFLQNPGTFSWLQETAGP